MFGETGEDAVERLWRKRRSDFLDLLERSSAGEEIEDEHDDGENQEDVNPASECVAADESNDPEDEENNRDSPKHFVLLDDGRLYFPVRE
jgi:hypothetical protein